MARYRGGSLTSIAACRQAPYFGPIGVGLPAAERHAEPAARGIAWRSTRVFAPDWRYRAAGGVSVAPAGAC